jgi:hypothetical protein
MSLYPRPTTDARCTVAARSLEPWKLVEAGLDHSRLRTMNYRCTSLLWGTPVGTNADRGKSNYSVQLLTVLRAAAAADRPHDASLPLHVSAVYNWPQVVNWSPGTAAAAPQNWANSLSWFFQ